MSTGDLQLRVECYVAVRKALGYACRSEEKLLKNFIRFLELNRASSPIRAQIAMEWVCAPAHGLGPSGQTNRLRVVRGFLSHLQAFEFETEVPGPGVLPPILRPLPYLYSPDEIGRINEGSFASRSLRFVATSHLRGIDRSARQFRITRRGSPSLKSGGGPTQLQPSAPTGCSNQIPKVASGSSASLVRREDSRVRCPKEASGLRCFVGCFLRV
jgi:hypothetical protein